MYCGCWPDVLPYQSCSQPAAPLCVYLMCRYVFAIGLLGSLGTGGGQQTKEQLIMEAYNWSGCSGGNIILTLRNVGPASIDVGGADFFVNGLPATPTGFIATLTPGQGDSGSLTAPTFSCTNGAAYALKIVTPTGGVFSYSIIAGGAS